MVANDQNSENMSPNGKIISKYNSIEPEISGHNLDSFQLEKLEKEVYGNNNVPIKKIKSNFNYIPEGQFAVVWPNAIVFLFGHFVYLYAAYWSLVDFCWKLTIWNIFLHVFAGLGVTAGAHRLWAHRSYKAKLPLRIFLAIGQSIAGQNCIYIWARDHRIHHKYSDTDADPHNINRGFFFAHVGWLLRKKHPEVIRRGRNVDFSDLRNDPVVKYQEIFYWPIFAFFAFVFPVLTPVWWWGASLKSSILWCFFHRMLTTLHGTWCVNSAAHMFGDRPYDEKIPPAENSYVALMTFGEGYHNYHHKFPFDYATSELGYSFNTAKMFLDLMASMGQAYDMKRAHIESVKSVKDKVRHSQPVKFCF